MPASILDTISTPADLKSLSYAELEHLAAELRAEMVAATSIHGGHLASSLGAVEIILALHRVLDCPRDHIVFDVGHQAYSHKLLTGRRGDFAHLRSIDGLSGFPKITESEYDSHDSGHASDALSTALGYALARDISGEDTCVAALVGDASFVGGMSFEALNEIGHSGTPLIIVLNDNGMSISRSVGGFANYLGRMRLSEKYTNFRDHIQDTVSSKGRIGRFLMGTGNAFKESVKQLVLPGGAFFEGFGVTYVGPVDGHDIAGLEAIFSDAKEARCPVLVHVVTEKGHGYGPAQEHPDVFHGVGPFDIASGKPLPKKGTASWTSVFSEEIVSMAQEDESIVAITAAMPNGTGLDAFSKKYPDRFFDVGIAEENAVTMASAMAMAGLKPFVAIYSTFIQRAFDQMMINVALQQQHVVFCLDRAGLVGEDGPTHHGAFDLSFMRTIPGMTILAPSNDQELRDAVRSAACMPGPVCIRYPRGSAVMVEPRERELWTDPKAVRVRAGSDGSLLAVGRMVENALKAAALLSDEGIELSVFDMRWVKPLDAEAVREAVSTGLVVTVEDNSVCGGFGSAVLESMAEQGLIAKTLRLGLPDGFMPQGTIAELHERAGLSAEGIAASVKAAL